MCGRFTLRTPLNLLVERFHLSDGLSLPPRFNVAPTQEVAAVRCPTGSRHRQLVLLRWGLVPSWAKDPTIGNRLINARSETVAERPAFRAAVKRRRCVVLADGYYEWQKVGKNKQPYLIRMRDERPFGMAGLWEHWSGDGSSSLETCTILTTAANQCTRLLHDRMPVLLDDDDWDLWLDERVQQIGDLEHLLQPYDSEQMVYNPVSRHVNSPRNDDPTCVQLLSDAD
jgi:putative SOS response-associated peptidase YedK